MVTNIPIKLLSVMILFLLSFPCFSQSTSAVFESEYQFAISINNTPHNNLYTNNLKVNKLIGKQAYNVKVFFQKNTDTVQTNIYLIDDGLTHIYTITKTVIQLKKIVPTPTYQNKNSIEINYLNNLIITVDTIIKDSTIEDTTYTIPFASYYHLDDYNGKIACPFPIKDSEQAKLRALIISESLEDSKLENAKLAIQDMDSACIMVKQTKELIVLFEFEETRVDFAKFMYNYTFDIDNYEKLYAAFNFENNKAELKKYIKTLQLK